MEQIGFHWKDFSEILYWVVLVNQFEKIHVTLKLDKKCRALHMQTYVIYYQFGSYRAVQSNQ